MPSSGRASGKSRCYTSSRFSPDGGTARARGRPGIGPADRGIFPALFAVSLIPVPKIGFGLDEQRRPRAERDRIAATICAWGISPDSKIAISRAVGGMQQRVAWPGARLQAEYSEDEPSALDRNAPHLKTIAANARETKTVMFITTKSRKPSRWERGS